MNFLNDKHERKSAVITAVILAVFLLVIFNFGLRYLDPPEEYGVAINLGDTDFGSGDPVENTKLSPPVEDTKVEKEVVEEKVLETPKEIIQEDLITDETVKDVPVVKKEKVKEKKKEVEKKEEEKEVVKEVPKPSKSTQDALNSLLKGNSKEGEKKGEGDDDREGVKGDKNGDPNSNKYYGKAGSGSDGDYNLAGRKALSKPIEKPECQQEGIVVVSITVDKNGKVINAVPGVKGTTNSAPCLLKPAKEAALRTTWNADENAPVNQKGTIIYKFSLSK